MAGDESERRIARRFLMTLPLRVLPREAQNHELRAQTRDVSYRGLYFLADAPFEVGSEFEFVLTLPQQMSQAGAGDIRCSGQGVRVESSSNGGLGIAAKSRIYVIVPPTPSVG